MGVGEIYSVFFCQYMCEIAECNSLQNFECCSIFVEISTSLLNTVDCYGYWWIDYVYFYFLSKFWMLFNFFGEFHFFTSHCRLLWILVNILCFLLFSFCFFVLSISDFGVVWLLLNILFSCFFPFCFEYPFIVAPR